jgi:hypothetical protein
MADGFTVNNFDHLAQQSDVSYGIYDTQGECWIGDETGPRVFTRADSAEMNGMPQETIAKLAAMLAGVQLGYAAGRLQPREFHEKELHLRDEVPTKMTALEALIKLESGDKGTL